MAEMTVQEMAKVIADEIWRQVCNSPFRGVYFDQDDIEDADVNARLDLVAMADVVLKAMRA